MEIKKTSGRVERPESPTHLASQEGASITPLPCVVTTIATPHFPFMNNPDWYQFKHRSSGFPLASGTGEQFRNAYKYYVRPYQMARNYIKNFGNRRSSLRRGYASRGRAGRGLKTFKNRARRGRGGKGVTFQHDRQLIYRRKSMPARKKRPWIRFKRKVHAVAEKQLGTRSVVFNDAVTSTNATLGNHGLSSIALYSNRSTSAWLNDINQLSAIENGGDQTAAVGETIDGTTKYYFQSGVLDLTLRNTTEIGNDPTTLAADATLEVDIYEMTSGKVWDDQDGAKSDMEGIFSQAQGDTKNIGGAGTGVQIISRGVTPWDVPLALGRWKLRIAKKTKFFLRSGQTLTYQMRDAGRRVMRNQTMIDQLGANKPGCTKWLFVIFKVIPGFTVGAGASDVKESITFGVTRKYMYKIEGMNESRDRLL